VGQVIANASMSLDGCIAKRRALARRMFGLVEPIGVIPYSADEPNEAMFALGFTDYWDTYFAGRAAPLGSSAPAEVVHALFYNFAPGEVARHIPKVWDTTTPEAAIAARCTPLCAPSRSRRIRTDEATFTPAGDSSRTASRRSPTTSPSCRTTPSDQPSSTS
jgi:helix-turn-helix protein